MKSKQILIPIIALTVLGGITMGVSQTYAQTSNNSFSPLVEKIAQSFGLDKTKVQSVVDQYQQEQKANREKQMQQKQEERLTTLVKDGKITEAQKQSILTELSALKKKYNPDLMKDMTMDQRKAQRQSMETELKTWANSQGIDISYVRPGFGGKGMGGMHPPDATP